METEALCSSVDDEAMGGARVHQGVNVLFCQRQRQSHGLSVGDTGEGTEGDLGTSVINEGVLHGVIIVHLEEVDPLHGALFEVILREFLKAVEAEPLFAATSNLLRREPE
jgi:hypothetical protein